MAVETRRNGVETASADTQLVQRVLGLRETVRTWYDVRNEQIRKVRLRRYQEQKPTIPEEYQATTQEVRLSLFADVADLMTAIVAQAPIRVHVDPASEGETAERNASLRERHAEALLEQLMVEAGRDLLEMVASNQMADGLGVWKLLQAMDNWAELATPTQAVGRSPDQYLPGDAGVVRATRDAQKRGLPLPIALTEVDPLTYYEVTGATGKCEAVLEIREHPIYEAAHHYRDTLGLRNGKLDYLGALGEPMPTSEQETIADARARVEVIEYWDKVCTLTLVDGLEVHYREHNYGTVPYFTCYAKRTADRQPERYGRPPLYKQIWLSDLLDNFWTMMTNVGFLFCYPTPVTKTPADADVPMVDNKPKHVEYKPGRHLALYKGQEFEFIALPAEQLKSLVSIIQQAREQFDVSSGLGPAIRGLAGGDASGYQVNQLIQASLLTLQTSIKSRDSMIEQMLRFVWRLIEHHMEGEAIVVHGTNPDPSKSGRTWLELKASDIKGYYRVQVQSQPMLDQMRATKGAFGADMEERGYITKRRMREEFLQIEDPLGEDDERWVEDQLQSEDLNATIVQHALMESGLVPPPPPEPLPGEMSPEMVQPEEVAAVAGPGMGPVAPGIGMPLVPPTPEPPMQSVEQMADQQGMLLPSRPAGADRLPPIQPIRPIAADLNSGGGV